MDRFWVKAFFAVGTLTFLIIGAVYLSYFVDYSDFGGIDESIPNGKYEKVIMEEDVFNILLSRYKSDVNEFMYCIDGEESDGVFYIDTIEEVTVYHSNRTAITYSSCEGMIGSIHSHPGGSCMLSRVDIYFFGVEGTQLEGIICREDQSGFKFFIPSDLRNPLKFSVE